MRNNNVLFRLVYYSCNRLICIWNRLRVTIEQAVSHTPYGYKRSGYLYPFIKIASVDVKRRDLVYLTQFLRTLGRNLLQD